MESGSNHVCDPKPTRDGSLQTTIGGHCCFDMQPLSSSYDADRAKYRVVAKSSIFNREQRPRREREPQRLASRRLTATGGGHCLAPRVM